MMAASGESPIVGSGPTLENNSNWRFGTLLRGGRTGSTHTA
jgi:hypothetical protein